MSDAEYLNLISSYQKVILDMGTGDGRFVYKNALEKKNNFWIGMDPSEKQLTIYSKKAVRKNLENVIFVVGSVENIPRELEYSCQKINIVFPWGTLLQKTVLAEKNFLKKLGNLYQNDKIHELEIILGFSPQLEPSESERLKLPEISISYLERNLIPAYERAGFKMEKIEIISKQELKKIESTWSKKLAYAKTREIFRLTFY